MTRTELLRQTQQPHVCGVVVGASECPPCKAHCALANWDADIRARREVLVNAVLVQAREALDCLDLSCAQGIDRQAALEAAFRELDAHDKEHPR